MTSIHCGQSESPEPGPITMLDRGERAHLGSAETTAWCPTCRERAVPMRNGTCGFCDTPLIQDTVAAELVDEELDRLAGMIAREHELIIKAGTAMIEHAIRCGEALVAAKERVPTGGWETWLASTFPDRSLKTWRLYMRLAKHKATVLAAAPANLNDAHQLLAGEPILPHGDDVKAEAHTLRKAGRTYAEISEELGVALNTIGTWLNPAVREAKRRRDGALSRTAQREALVADRDRLVAEYGGDLARAYGQLREAGETLRELVAQGADGPVKLALTKTLQAEDQLAKAATTEREEAAHAA